MFIWGVILDVNQCNVQNIQTNLYSDINQIAERIYLLERMMLAIFLKSPAFTETGQMQGVAVHAKFKFSILML